MFSDAESLSSLDNVCQRAYESFNTMDDDFYNGGMIFYSCGHNSLGITHSSILTLSSDEACYYDMCYTNGLEFLRCKVCMVSNGRQDDFVSCCVNYDCDISDIPKSSSVEDYYKYCTNVTADEYNGHMSDEIMCSDDSANDVFQHMPALVWLDENQPDEFDMQFTDEHQCDVRRYDFSTSANVSKVPVTLACIFILVGAVVGVAFHFKSTFRSDSKKTHLMQDATAEETHGTTIATVNGRRLQID